MMLRTLFVLVAFSIGLFGWGPIQQFIAHSQPYGVAWAQDAPDSDNSADVSTDLDAKMKPPDLKGMWSGIINDNSAGIVSFTIDITQKGSKLKGDWMTGNGGSGTFVGKVKNDDMSLSFKFKQKHSKCRISADGTLGVAAAVTGDIAVDNAITGIYRAEKCEGATSGSFSLTIGGV